MRLFIARKELLASLAGVDRASPSGQLGIVVGFGQDTSRHELASMQNLQGAEKEPQERTSRGCWHCREMAHHAWKCLLPEDWKKFWCKYYPTKKQETEGFAKMPSELRKRYLKQEGGQWMIIGERTASGESKSSALRRSGR
jgi:hypothetical protein